MARDKGEHINSESTVYTAAVVCLYWLAPIRKTKTPVNYIIYRHAAKHNDVYSFRKHPGCGKRCQTKARKAEMASFVASTSVFIMQITLL